MLRSQLLLPAACAALTGCIPSLYPLYSQRDLVKDARVEGAWVASDKPSHTWKFMPHKDGYYVADQREGDEKGLFQARLLRLDGQLYMDLYPDTMWKDDENPLNATAWWGVHFPPAHTFYKLALSDSKLEIRSMNGNWLKELFSREPNALARAPGREIDEFVITAPTDELQRFIGKHRNDANMWEGNPLRLVRTK